MQHSRPTLAFKHLILLLPFLYFLHLHPHHRLLLLGVSTSPVSSSTPPPDSLWVLQWKTGGLRARSTELLHFISSHPIDFICIQDSNLNSSPFFRIPKFSALRSDCTHSWSGILSLVMPGTLAAASSFSPGRIYPSRSFLPPLFG